MSKHREARLKARPAGSGEQERPGEAVGHGEVGDDVECLRCGRCGDLRRHAERCGEVRCVDVWGSETLLRL